VIYLLEVSSLPQRSTLWSRAHFWLDNLLPFLELLPLLLARFNNAHFRWVAVEGFNEFFLGFFRQLLPCLLIKVDPAGWLQIGINILNSGILMQWADSPDGIHHVGWIGIHKVHHSTREEGLRRCYRYHWMEKYPLPNAGIYSASGWIGFGINRTLYRPTYHLVVGQLR